MRLRERLRLLLHKFERALTRVEDQGVRVEQGVDNIVDLMVLLNDRVGQLSYDVTERYKRSEREVTSLKQRLTVLEKSLESRQPPTH